MMNKFSDFAKAVVKTLTKQNKCYLNHPDSPYKIQIYKTENEVATLDLTPFFATPDVVTALPFFDGVHNIDTLLEAYQKARSALPFEDDIPEAKANVSDYATTFIENIFSKAQQNFSDQQAVLIANWVKQLDIYCAVKSVESLLNSCADLKLLELANQQGWHIHFDHMAIRCGSRAHHDAERVVKLLTEHHGYVASQVSEEAFYQFTDGWNAYPMYKVLENGQVLRVFVDQSDADASSQIIQHWNRVYGYTSHHLAMRATTIDNQGEKKAVPLDDVIQLLETNNNPVLTPTGHYTEGLLLQVFTKPEKNREIPKALKQSIIAIHPNLDKTIENGKLLELVSRTELPQPYAEQLFALYGLEYDASNPLHSAPVYQYFLPAQAAHVIKTSIQTE